MGTSSPFIPVLPFQPQGQLICSLRSTNLSLVRAHQQQQTAQFDIMWMVEEEPGLPACAHSPIGSRLHSCGSFPKKHSDTYFCEPINLHHSDHIMAALLTKRVQLDKVLPRSVFSSISSSSPKWIPTPLPPLQARLHNRTHYSL
uniref:Uncharacterized protein n=1 Tax=Anopheles culicifacies TaxID=139723 RepID=A0A182MLK2_9DIPT